MIKKHLLGGVLLASVLVLLTGCKEMMSSLDNPVSAYLKVDPASTKIYRGQSYKIPYSTISDAKPIFKSADEKVAVVDENGVVTGANRGTTKISITLPATDYYNGASAEFTVEVDALLNLPKDAKELALNEVYNLGVTSVSTGAITYKSSNTKVATVDADGNVTAKGYGDATITISIAATPQYDRTETAEFAATVRVQDLDQLNAVIASGDDVTVLLSAENTITVTSELSLSGKKVTIKGDKDKPGMLVMNKGFVINDNFKIENVNIDAKTNTSVALIMLDKNGCTKKNQDVFPDAATTGFNLCDEVSINNVMIKDLKKSLISSNTQDWALVDLNVNNSIIQLDNTTNVFIQFNSTKNSKGSVKNIKFTNNTIYNINTGSSHYFIRFANASNAAKAFGTNAGTSTFDYQFENNTFVNISKGQNFGNNTPNNGKVTVIMKNNIYYDVKYIDKFAQGNCAKTIENNFYYGVAASSGATTYMATLLEDAPFTAPTTALDLTKKYGGLNLKTSGAAANAGDPRWNEIN